MTIQLQKPDIAELKPRISVFGVGGGGGNAVNNMINAGLQGVEFVVANTDAQALTMSKAERRIQLGVNATDGLGAGSHPEIGREAAEECLDEILDHLGSSHMVFVTAGMGGGTGTGAAPVIARAAREKGILTVGVVTKPFHFEGQRRMKTAEAGIEELQKNVDTLIVIPNQNLFRIATEQTTFADAFSMADQVLYSGVASITDLMVHEGLVNLDFADVRSVMQKMGKAMMGTGEASDNGRALAAAEAAIANPLLDETSMRGARGLLISITGGRDMTLFEVDEAANRIREEVDPDANVIFGAIIDEALEGVIRVSVVATGIDARVGEFGERGDHEFGAGQEARNAAPQALSAHAGAQSASAASFLKKESLTVPPVAEAPAEDDEEEEEDYAEAAESEQEFAETEDRSEQAQARAFNAAPRVNPSAARAPGFANGRAENAAAENAAELPGREQAENAPARAAMWQKPAGASRPAERSEQGVYERASAGMSGMETFPQEMRRSFPRQDKEERGETVGGARGFIKKLQNLFGGGEEITARLEPAEEQAEPAADFAAPNGGLPRYGNAPAEAPARFDRRPMAHMARSAPLPRPDTVLYNEPRGQGQFAGQAQGQFQGQARPAVRRPEEREEEKLDIPAFLRRQSH